MTKQAHIYAIQDPRSSATIYVGRSKNPRNRLANMKARARAGECGNLYRELRAILAAGAEPEVRVLATVSVSEEGAAELEWIKRLRAAGEPLVNVRVGGGPSSGVVVRRRAASRHPNQEATQFQPLDPASPTVLLQVRVPRALLDRVDAAAKDRGVTRSELVRRALEAVTQ